MPEGVHRALSNANSGIRTMSFNNGPVPGVWVASGGANAGSRWAFESPGPLQSLKLLAEDAQLETKRSNEGDPSQSETSEALCARRVNYLGVLDLAG
jgi:hypothetical protein